MKSIISVLLLLSFTLTGCIFAARTEGTNPKTLTTFQNSDKLSALKNDKKLYEKQKKDLEGQLGLAKRELCGTVMVSCGKSFPGGMSHIDYRHDPTNVSTWRDPLTKGDAEDNFVKTKGEIEWIEDNLKETEKALAKVNREIQEQERFESGGGGGGGGSSGGGGGGGY